MSDLIFNPDKNKFGDKLYSQEVKKSKLSEWLIKISGGKLDEQKANYVMIGILGIIILATIIILYSTFSVRGKSNLPVIPLPQDDMQ